MKKIVLFVMVLTLCLNISLTAHASAIPNITAKGAVLIDLDSGQVLLEKGSHVKLHPASTTKILTALLTLEKCKLTDKVTVGKNPPLEIGSKVYLIKGEEFTVEQLLYAMLLESANDAALALAEHISGNKAEFAKLMNAKAMQLNCHDTNFLNPNGLYDENHFTSAYDLALITREAMKNPEFRKIVSTISYTQPPTNKQKLARHYHNHNKLLAGRKKYKGATGVKTGYTVQSGQALVATATRGNLNLLSVVLCDVRTVFEDTKGILDYGFNNFKTEKILSASIPADYIAIENSSTKIPVYPDKDYYISYKTSQKPAITKNMIYYQKYESLKKGEKVGYIELKSSNGISDTIPVIAGGDYSSSFYNLKLSKSGELKKVIKLRDLAIPITAVLVLFIGRGFYRKYKRKSRYKRY